MRELIADVDSYKFSHYLQDPPGLTKKVFYLEARNDSIFPEVQFFGLQPILHVLEKGITKDDVAEVGALAEAHGEPFNYADWNLIAGDLKGKLPIKISAVPEGIRVPKDNILLRVENTDPRFPWLGGFLETQLMRTWYTTAVCTLSGDMRIKIQQALDLSSDDPKNQLPFKLHDFGSRGVTCPEQAGLGGVAHLVNFLGTDTFLSLYKAQLDYYHKGPAGFSIPAAEHSTILSWGPEGEYSAYENMLRRFAHPGKLVAVVSDTYNLWTAIDSLWGDSLRKMVIESGAVVIIRPDSGNPAKVVVEALRRLEAKFGSDKNHKGYRVLKHVRIIQGDGITKESLPGILLAVMDAGFSVDNVAFGMGAGLLQKLNRDDVSFAYKVCWIETNSKGKGVKKSPVDAPEKGSKAGYLGLAYADKKFITFDLSNNPKGYKDYLIPVFSDGEVQVEYSLEDVRRNAWD